MENKDATADVDDRPAEGSLTEQFAARPEATAGTRAAQRGNAGSWIAVSMIILGFALGACALPTHWLILWIMTGVALVVGGILALTSRIMDQAH
ncbi:hypothetical protein I6A60_32085 [Frankia sp. AgB1.9]|uniref:hypothetical protein n=1 Tax=unclassified Frankia TaxID=2632575 RepID=UPI0019319EE8|nr:MULTISPECIES: hypothetical protein [unclassified Frankia]MBL7494227.1 hypothetical protein [Frankia sp. AgW1.1]MBL7552466.1 hypothetical protein [Frankia sp. AgB1.9]MBL7623568.1 hypothetical protein [Frankia sp. AgB1.8]